MSSKSSSSSKTVAALRRMEPELRMYVIRSLLNEQGKRAPREKPPTARRRRTKAGR